MAGDPGTPDPVELVYKQVDALDRRDLDGVIGGVAEDGVLDGRAAVGLVRETSGDVVLIRARVYDRAKTTGIEMTTQFFHSWAFRAGKPWRCYVRSTEAEALKAVGLEE